MVGLPRHLTAHRPSCLEMLRCSSEPNLMEVKECKEKMSVRKRCAISPPLRTTQNITQERLEGMTHNSIYCSLPSPP